LQQNFGETNANKEEKDSEEDKALLKAKRKAGKVQYGDPYLH
jgi:hypothetical protein